jgi:hypothetical protein
VVVLVERMANNLLLLLVGVEAGIYNPLIQSFSLITC